MNKIAYTAGRQAALTKLALTRAPDMSYADEDDLTDNNIPWNVRQQILDAHLQDVAGHRVSPVDEYVQATRGAAMPILGIPAGIYGAGVGAAMAKNPLRGGLAGLAIGGALGTGAGYLLGGPLGRAQHADDLAAVGDAQHLLGNDLEFQRRLIDMSRRGYDRDLDREHQRQIELANIAANRTNRNFNYNVNTSPDDYTGDAL